MAHILTTGNLHKVTFANRTYHVVTEQYTRHIFRFDVDQRVPVSARSAEAKSLLALVRWHEASHRMESVLPALYIVPDDYYTSAAAK